MQKQFSWGFLALGLIRVCNQAICLVCSCSETWPRLEDPFARWLSFKVTDRRPQLLADFWSKDSVSHCLVFSQVFHMAWRWLPPEQEIQEWYNSGQWDLSPLCYTSAFFRVNICVPFTFLSLCLPSSLSLCQNATSLDQERGCEGYNNRIEGIWFLDAVNHHVNYGRLSQSFI